MTLAKPSIATEFIKDIATGNPDIPIPANLKQSDGICLKFLHVYLRDGIGILVENINALLGAKPDALVPALTNAVNGVDVHQSGCMEIATKHMDGIAIVTTQSVYGAIPHIAF